MDYTGVISATDETLAKIECADICDGHGPMLSGKELCAKPDLSALPPPPTLPTSVEGGGTPSPGQQEANQAPKPLAATGERSPLQATPAADNIQLTILTEPAGATVYFNGRMLPGVTPLTQSLPRVKEATIRVSAPGYQDRTEEVLLSDGTLQKFKFTLTKRGGGAVSRPQPKPAVRKTPAARPARVDDEEDFAAEVGTVTVASVPSARVWEGREELCESTPCEIELPVGKHKIVLSNPAEGFETSRTFNLRAGQILSFDIEVAKGELYEIFNG